MRYHLKVGDRFLIQQHAHQTITQESDGMAHVITNDLPGVMEFDVVKEKEDAYQIEVVFKNLKLKVNSSLQGDLLLVDALDFEKDDAQSKMFNSLLNIPVTILMSNRGEIQEVIGGDQLVAKMIEASGTEDPNEIEYLKISLNNEFGSEALSESYEQLTFIYPAEAQKKGDLWQNEFDGKLKAKNTWTLAGITKDSLHIQGSSKITMDINDENSSMKLEGSQNSTVNVNTKSGFVSKMRVEGVAEGVALVGALGAKEIPTQIKSTIIYQLIEN
ncbi:MAG: DUF6263 family protein [Eudoraea sp.]|uniref:DUF6263 family protein n=1 Tax=Eudoraea sp. TaxID=1979955 RepID=UPI003C77DEA9